MQIREPQTLHCNACHYLWSDNIVFGEEMSVCAWLACVKSLSCPNCLAGYDRISLVTELAQLPVRSYVDGFVADR